MAPKQEHRRAQIGLSRSFAIPTSKAGENLDITLHEPALTSENLRLTTWGSSLILANQLHLIDPGLLVRSDPTTTTSTPTASSSSSSSINVLELGAGTGLVGISAAAIWHTDVILTDLSPIIPGIATNISANDAVLSTAGATVTCGTLDWAVPETLLLHTPPPPTTTTRAQPAAPPLLASTHKASVILAADTIYGPEHPAMLSTTILTWLKPGPDARVLIAYPLRVAYLDEIRELWERLERGGLEAVEEGKEELASDDFDDETLHEWSVWRWKVGGGERGTG